MHLDAGAVRQVDRLARLALDLRREHRYALEKAEHVAEHHTRLPAVRGDHHHRSALARSQRLRVVAEAGEVDRDERRNPAFPSTATDDDPGFT
jgi:hypothetical protein